MTRLLFVHAHPDDETLATGIGIAWALQQGHDVDVLTCTLGDEGEVIPPRLAHLVAARDDSLWAHRRGELGRAMARLAEARTGGARLRHTLLGDEQWSMPGASVTPAAPKPVRYRDSGMAGTPSAAHPRAFVGADLAEAAEAVVEVLQESDPDLVVTYDADGGYGHPDHIQTRRVVLAALARLGTDLPALVEIVTPQSWVDQDRRWLRAHVPVGKGLIIPSPQSPFAVSVVPDGIVTHEVVAPELVGVQANALREHETQVVVGEGYYALSNGIAARLSGREAYAAIDPTTGRRQARASGAKTSRLVSSGAPGGDANINEGQVSADAQE